MVQVLLKVSIKTFCYCLSSDLQDKLNEKLSEKEKGQQAESLARNCETASHAPRA